MSIASPDPPGVQAHPARSYAASAKESPEIVRALDRGISEGLAERLDPHARLADFVARDPDAAGCEIAVEGLTVG